MLGGEPMRKTLTFVDANQSLEYRQEAFDQRQRALKERCIILQEQRSFLNEQRRAFGQRRLDFLNTVSNMWQENNNCIAWWHGLRQRICQADDLIQMPRRQQVYARLQIEGFQEQLLMLREQRQTIQEQMDIEQKQHSFREIEASYDDLLQQLKERQHFLRERCITYRQLRLDYEEQRLHLCAVRNAKMQQKSSEERVE
ncbi:hypothetical protein KDH_48810 [Dictyobacter sp. S3.2.2.5]|uniref:Flagellar FliJ protein n=2 Tax=Dictyobacter halimunensis TaxID=3026934 RepID=A0ABQ6FYH0_9CHLR|nr:hypothetical protein KDH_48810 [Dictyobacter sp. S3.2.2.5]